MGDWTQIGKVPVDGAGSPLRDDLSHLDVAPRDDPLGVDLAALLVGAVLLLELQYPALHAVARRGRGRERGLGERDEARAGRLLVPVAARLPEPLDPHDRVLGPPPEAARPRRPGSVRADRSRRARRRAAAAHAAGRRERPARPVRRRVEDHGRRLARGHRLRMGVGAPHFRVAPVRVLLAAEPLEQALVEPVARRLAGALGLAEPEQGGHLLAQVVRERPARLPVRLGHRQEVERFICAMQNSA